MLSVLFCSAPDFNHLLYFINIPKWRLIDSRLIDSLLHDIANIVSEQTEIRATDPERCVAIMPCLNALQAFLRDEYSEENAIFWQKCEEYRKSSNAAYQKQLARLIYVDHVAESSADQVNIDAHVRLTIERRLSTAPVNLLDDAQRQVYLLMKYDPYPRFLRSPLYRDAVNADRLNKRLQVPAADDVTSGPVGGSLLSRLRRKWKGPRTSKLTTAKDDDSGHGTSLSSLGSDGGDAEQSRSVDDTPAAAAVTPSTLLNRLLRRMSASKSVIRDNVESSTAASALASVPTARRHLFFDRWRRSTDVDDDDDDARSVSTVASARTTVDSSPHRPARPSDTHRRRHSGPVSHVIRCDADERRRFAEVMARVAAARGGGGGEAPAASAACSDTDGQRQRHDLGARLSSAVTNELRRRRRHRRRGTATSKSTNTSSDIEYTVYFV